MKIGDIVQRIPETFGETEIVQAKDRKQPKKERKPLTEAQRLKRQKMIVLPAIVLVFIGAMWLIFAPSSDLSLIHI